MFQMFAAEVVRQIARVASCSYDVRNVSCTFTDNCLINVVCFF